MDDIEMGRRERNVPRREGDPVLGIGGGGDRTEPSDPNAIRTDLLPGQAGKSDRQNRDLMALAGENRGQGRCDLGDAVMRRLKAIGEKCHVHGR